jgi:hypothetical protein
LDDNTYLDYALTPDHFLPPGTDLDIYITEPVHPQTCLQDLHSYLRDALPGYSIVARPTQYACTRLWISTAPHPIAPVVRIQLDLVMAGERTMFPDFTSNTGSVDTKTGALSVLCPPGMDPWWDSLRHQCLCLSLPPHVPASILAGSRDLLRRATDGIKAQIQAKKSHVLLFSFARWSAERARLQEPRSRRAYSAYVSSIVSGRLPKLLAAGFVVDGFRPGLSAVGDFDCGEHTTDIRHVRIGSSATPGSMVLQEEEEEEQDEDEVKPYYWCGGCEEWHEIAQFLL